VQLDDRDAGAPAIAAALDELTDSFGGGEFTGQVSQARAEFDERRGRVFEDEELYEAWTVAFLEWYVCERVLDGGDLPPAGQVARDRPEDRTVRALLCSHRSLFEVQRVTGTHVSLVDLVGGAAFDVSEPRAMHGVSRGDVVETRLVGLGGRVLFTRTFVYHPPGTRAPIVDHVRRLRAAGSDRRDIIDYVSRLRVRCERYGHMSPEKMYAAGHPSS